MDNEGNDSEGLYLDDEWQQIVRFLPTGWQDQARVEGAIRRTMRNIPDTESLLRILLIHLAGGCSLVETAERSRLGNIADVSSVALHKRLKASGAWFGWMSCQLRNALSLLPVPEGRRMLAVDASAISEPGSTGTDWYVHYGIDLRTLQCAHFELSDYQSGERLDRYPLKEGDICIADRMYGSVKSAAYAMGKGADLIVRVKSKGLNFWDNDGEKIDCQRRFASLSQPGDIGSWPASIGAAAPHRFPGRLVCIRKNMAATEATRQKIHRIAARKQKTVSQAALNMAPYFFVWTTLDQCSADNATVLHWYRLRWQVELAFKRLKSLMNLGHLPKKDPDTAQAWLQGKLFASLLLERIHAEAESFSPWGFPLEGAQESVA
ncbi:MAG: IS4/IS5 family transposase [Planctomycetota bacterium]|nr:MAG: IS4/IS5 family transposase [Planctomycetota bacterium]